MFGRGKCEFGVEMGRKQEKNRGKWEFCVASCCDECLRLDVQLRCRLLTTRQEAARQKDHDQNESSDVM